MSARFSDKVARVTGTQQAVQQAGRDDELAYQEMLKGLELKRDMETLLVGVNIAKVTGSELTARKTASILSWIKSNTSKGAGGADPSAADGTGTRTDGTPRAFTEANLKAVLQSVWNNGGKPDTIMLGGFNKQVMSTFTGRATPTEETKSKKIIAAVDAYEFDFGTVKVVPNRFQRARDVLVLEMDKWAVAYLTGRKMLSIPLAKTGDSDRPPDALGIRAGGEEREGLGRRVRQHHVVSAACERGHGATRAVPVCAHPSTADGGSFGASLMSRRRSTCRDAVRRGNRRAEMWGQVETLARRAGRRASAGSRFIAGRRLRAVLSLRNLGRLVLESKEDMRRRDALSPDEGCGL